MEGQDLKGNIKPRKNVNSNNCSNHRVVYQNSLNFVKIIAKERLTEMFGAGQPLFPQNFLTNLKTDRPPVT